jgi:aspartate carbamoyltransferase catalytic subunit
VSEHLLSTKGFTRDSAVTLLDVAEDMADTQRRQVKKLPTLRGTTIVNLFFEDSTRTRISFEAAAKRLSADVITFSAKGSSVSKGESLQDTAQTLQAMGADGIVIRHASSGAAHTLATSGWTRAGVVNAGDGTHEHPTQALLDAFTIRKRRHGATSRASASSSSATSCTAASRDRTCGCSPRWAPPCTSSRRRPCSRRTPRAGR